MKNRELPAQTLDSKQIEEIDGGFWNGDYYGLSKIEYAAIKAMQGILASGDVDQSRLSDTSGSLARTAIKVANAIFNELEKDNEPL